MIKRIEKAIADINAGKPIIIVDDFSRENEGDLMIAGPRVRIDNIAYMCRYGRGIMCLPTTGEILDRLDVPMMVSDSSDPLETPFTVSVDARYNITTGVSAADRVETIKVMCDPTSKPEHLVRPGHLFPLRARDKLLAERRGHTEASVTLLRMLDMQPVAVIAEIMNDDGTMARVPELEKMAKEHELHIIAIDDIVEALESGYYGIEGNTYKGLQSLQLG